MFNSSFKSLRSSIYLPFKSTIDSSSVLKSPFKCCSTTARFTKLITPVELRTRQRRLVENVFKLETTGCSDYLILIPGAIRSFQTDTIIPNIHFKQTSDFTYFTGLNRIDSSECVLALIANDGKIKEVNLYSPTISEHQSVWEGKLYISRLVDHLTHSFFLFFCLVVLA